MAALSIIVVCGVGGPLLTIVVIYLIIEWLKPKVNIPPGPNGVPLLGHMPFLGQEPHKVFLELSKKYGGLYSLKLGPRLAVILNEHKVFKEVMSHSAALDRPPDFFDHLPERGFFLSNGEDWNEQRRFCMQTTKEIGMGRTEWEKNLEEEIADLLDELRSHQGKPVSIQKMIARLTSMLMLSLLIGRRLDKVRERDQVDMVTQFMHYSMANSGLSNPVQMFPWLRLMLEKLKIAKYHKTAECIRAFSKFIRQEISSRQNNPEYKDTVDFLTIYLNKLKEMNMRSTKHYYSESNLRGHVNVLFLGGSDTSAMSLEYLFRIMASHKDIQNNIHKELDEVIGSDGQLPYSQKDRAPYVMAVLMEVQRFSSLVPVCPVRLASADIHVNGYVIPKGTQVIANLYALHRDEQFWPEPEKFKPERFLTQEGHVTKNVSSFYPFSTGRRSCPGEMVAWKEIFTIFTCVMQKFQVDVPEGMDVSFETFNGVVPQFKHQLLCFKQR